MRSKVLSLVSLTILAAGSPKVSGQTTARVEFEVASVRPNHSASGSSSSHSTNGRYQSSNEPLMQLIRYAFQVREPEIIGPSWLTSERYDIQAKAPEGIPDSQMNLMLQSLLIDQFKMKFHREVREMPIFALLVAKGGHKLVEATDADRGGSSRAAAPTGGAVTNAGAGGGAGTSSGVPTPRLSTMRSTGTVSSFAGSLTRTMERTVVDMTGLQGRYTIMLAYKPENAPPEDPGPSIFTALTEQLGLRLESRKGPVEVIVIDSIEKVQE